MPARARQHRIGAGIEVKRESEGAQPAGSLAHQKRDWSNLALAQVAVAQGGQLGVNRLETPFGQQIGRARDSRAHAQHAAGAPEVDGHEVSGSGLGRGAVRAEKLASLGEECAS